MLAFMIGLPRVRDEAPAACSGTARRRNGEAAPPRTGDRERTPRSSLQQVGEPRAGSVDVDTVGRRGDRPPPRHVACAVLARAPVLNRVDNRGGVSRGPARPAFRENVPARARCVVSRSGERDDLAVDDPGPTLIELGPFFRGHVCRGRRGRCGAPASMTTTTPRPSEDERGAQAGCTTTDDHVVVVLLHGGHAASAGLATGASAATTGRLDALDDHVHADRELPRGDRQREQHRGRRGLTIRRTSSTGRRRTAAAHPRVPSPG